MPVLVDRHDRPPDAADWEQAIVPVFVARLIRAGVRPAVIEAAIVMANGVQLGESATSDDPERRAFCEQMGRLLARCPASAA